jgi:hypothetical protein
VPGEDLPAELEELALAIAQRFDVRNGTDSISSVGPETLTAEPLVDELVLSPTAVKRMPRSAPVVVESIVEPLGPAPWRCPRRRSRTDAHHIEEADPRGARCGCRPRRLRPAVLRSTR